MSPEQAKGKPADRRADIWAFGVVLYEMLVGKQAFTGDTAAETLASVLKEPISFERLPVETPPAVRSLLARCLERDLRVRLQAIGEARIILEKPDVGQAISSPALPTPSAPSWSRLGTVVTAAALVVASVLAFLHFRETPPPERTLRYTIPGPENSTLQSLAVSPDGRYVVIAATANGKQQLWLRSLELLQAQPMPTTDDATYPFWSPDSRYIGFFAQGKLKKIDARGGPSQTLCDAPSARGGSWSREDVLVFAQNFGNAGLDSVKAAGGVSAKVPKTENSRFPFFLPDGRHFIYLVQQTSPEKNGIYVGSLDGKDNRRILPDVSSVVYAPPASGHLGHLLFIRENNLMAQPFDSGSMQMSGDLFPAADAVALAQANFAPISVSENGLLLYWTGGFGGGGNNAGGNNQIVWYDKTGKLIETVGAPGSSLAPALSPDEKTIAFARFNNTPGDIWLRDLARGNEQRFTTDASANTQPFWSPNSDRIVYRSQRGGHPGDIYQRAVNGSGQDEVLVTTPNAKVVDQWSRDGRFIVYHELDPKTKEDLWVLPMGGGWRP
jgi:Tol biopolymer transport system component